MNVMKDTRACEFRDNPIISVRRLFYRLKVNDYVRSIKEFAQTARALIWRRLYFHTLVDLYEMCMCSGGINYGLREPVECCEENSFQKDGSHI